MAKIEYQVNTASPFGALGAATVGRGELAYVTYDPANKPTFTAPGVYSVDYRSTDAAGNVETAKSVAFTITAPNNDHTAPVTTQTLDPAAPGAGKTYSGSGQGQVLGAGSVAGRPRRPRRSTSTRRATAGLRRP